MKGRKMNDRMIEVMAPNGGKTMVPLFALTKQLNRTASALELAGLGLKIQIQTYETKAKRPYVRRQVGMAAKKAKKS